MRMIEWKLGPKVIILGFVARGIKWAYLEAFPQAVAEWLVKLGAGLEES